MPDFLTRLAKRTLGLMPRVEPNIPSLFTSESSQEGISGHWTDVLTREPVLLSSKIQPSIPSLFTPESNQGGISGRGTDGLAREHVLFSSEQSLSCVAQPPSDLPLDAPEAVGEFGKPNPPAPFPAREGGTGLPSPLSGEVKPLINSPTVSVPLQARTQEKVSPNLPPPANTTAVNPTVNSALGVTPRLETPSVRISSDARLDPPQPPLIRGEKVADTRQRGIMPGIEPSSPDAIAQSNAVDFPASTHFPTNLSSANSTSASQLPTPAPAPRRESEQVSSVRSPVDPNIQSVFLTNSTNASHLPTPAPAPRQESEPVSSVRSQVDPNIQSANPTNSISTSQLPTPAPAPRQESEPASSVRSPVDPNIQSANPTNSISTSQLPTPVSAPRRESEPASSVRSQVDPNIQSAFLTNSTSASQLPTPASAPRQESEPASSVRSPFDAAMPVIPQSSSVNVPESLEFTTPTTHLSLPQEMPLKVRETSERKLPDRSPVPSATMMPQPPLVNAPQALTSSFPGLDTPLTSEATAIAQPLSRQQARLLKIDAQRAAQSDPLNPASWPSQSPPESPPTIQVTIGRVEVRVSNSSPPPRPRSPRRNPSLSLNDYLQQRNERSL